MARILGKILPFQGRKYKDNAENQALDRVGKPWGSGEGEPAKDDKKGEEEQLKIRRLGDFIGKDGMTLYKTYGKKNGVMESVKV